MTPLEKFLSRVDGVRQSGRGRYSFKVPTRNDKHPSGSVRELDDGRILIHDFGGDSVPAILEAIGLELSDLFPDKLTDHGKSERRPFGAVEALRCAAFEALVVLAADNALAKGKPLSEADHERLVLAAERLQHAANVARL